MKIKEGANISGISLKLRPALIAADKLWKEHGEELVVTSGLDGTHSAGSLHYYGLAVDFRTRYWDTEEQRIVGQELREVLGEDYDVIVHSTHIHVEYDPD